MFVKSISKNGDVHEKVYEMAHLEILPPGTKVGLNKLSAYFDDGIWRITCQNSHDEIWVYNDDRCWNPDLKKSFMRRVTNLWSNDLTKPYKP